MDSCPKKLSDSPILIETKTSGFISDSVEILLKTLEFTFYEGGETCHNFAHTTGWRNLPFSVFSCLLTNSGKHEIKGNKPVLIKAGQAIVIPTGMQHKSDVNTPQGVSAIWMHFSFRLLGCLDFFSLVKLPSFVLKGKIAATGRETIREIIQLYTTVDDEPLLLMARRRAAVDRFLLFLVNLYQPLPRCVQLIQISQRLKPTIDFIQQHYKEPLTRDQLAHTAHLSRSRFHDLFHQLTGMAPLDYVKQCRLQAAQLLLLTTKQRIADIASEVGYSDPFHFSRLFRASLGVSPRQFRRNCVEKSL